MKVVENDPRTKPLRPSPSAELEPAAEKDMDFEPPSVTVSERERLWLLASIEPAEAESAERRDALEVLGELIEKDSRE